MSFMRSASTVRLVRASQSAVRPLRCFSTTSTRSLREPDPRAIPDAEAMQATEDQASMIEAEHTSESHLETYHPRNQPEYSAHTDQGTSTYSPVPRRLLDGSEDRDTTPAAILSGAPVDLQARTVRIYKPTKPATQSGNWGGHNWRMDWDPLPRGHRWENPLMGWQSSADWMQGTKLNFRSKEEAVAFAEKQGYEYYVQEPNTRRFVVKAYANNFLHEAGPLKHIKTK